MSSFGAAFAAVMAETVLGALQFVGHVSHAAGSQQQLMCCLCRREKVFLPSLDEPDPARREGISAEV